MLCAPILRYFNMESGWSPNQTPVHYRHPAQRKVLFFLFRLVEWVKITGLIWEPNMKWFQKWCWKMFYKTCVSLTAWFAKSVDCAKREVYLTHGTINLMMFCLRLVMVCFIAFYMRVCMNMAQNMASTISNNHTNVYEMRLSIRLALAVCLVCLCVSAKCNSKPRQQTTAHSA